MGDVAGCSHLRFKNCRYDLKGCIVLAIDTCLINCAYLSRDILWMLFASAARFNSLTTTALCLSTYCAFDSSPPHFCLLHGITFPSFITFVLTLRPPIFTTKRSQFRWVTCDEGRAVKNNTSTVHKLIRRLDREAMNICTATPLCMVDIPQSVAWR